MPSVAGSPGWSAGPPRRLTTANGEDGVIAEILARVGRRSGYFVEFGIGAGNEGNCVLLADVFGWSGLFIEADATGFAGLRAKYGEQARITVRNTLVSAANIDDLFTEAGVPSEPDILSIDIDGDDYWVWEGVRSFRPRLVVVEYNSSLPLDSQLVHPAGAAWDGATSFFGASLGALERLARAKGYGLVHTDLAGINAFFVRHDLLELVGVAEPPRHGPNYFLASASFPATPGQPWVDLAALPEA